MAAYYGQQPQIFERKVRFEWINEAWQLYREQPGARIGATIVVLILELGLTIGLEFGFGLIRLGTIAPSPFWIYRQPAYYLVMAIGTVIGAFLNVGMFRMANEHVRGQRISAATIFSGASRTPAMIAYQIMFSIVYMIGFCFCILPAFLVLGLLAPGYALVSDGGGPIDSLSRSFAAVSRDFLMAWLFAFVVMLLFSIASAATLGLGLLVFVPMMFLVCSLAYRDMIGMPAAPGAVYGAGGLASTQPGVWPPPPDAGRTDDASSV